MSVYIGVLLEVLFSILRKGGDDQSHCFPDVFLGFRNTRRQLAQMKRCDPPHLCSHALPWAALEKQKQKVTVTQNWKHRTKSAF